MNNVLQVKGLTKWFGKIRAIENLSFNVSQGQVVGVLGPNGSGKTTTLAIVLGVKHPSEGAFSWFNELECKLANTRIGSLLEVPYFYPYLNLEKNLEIVARIRGTGLNQITEVLGIVGLDKRRKSAYYTLSLGMKQRLALASVLLGDPEVLVLDEPTNGLDPEGIVEVRDIILEQKQKGKTIIIASHILDEVEKVCTDVIILKNGVIVSSGPVNKLLSEKQQVIVSAKDMNLLKETLALHQGIELVDASDEKVLISLSGEVSTADLNHWLMDRGIILSQIETIKKSLESQFLELVRQQ